MSGENFYFLDLLYLLFCVNSLRVLAPEALVLISLQGVTSVVFGGPTSLTFILSKVVVGNILYVLYFSWVKLSESLGLGILKFAKGDLENFSSISFLNFKSSLSMF